MMTGCIQQDKTYKKKEQVTSATFGVGHFYMGSGFFYGTFTHTIYEIVIKSTIKKA